MRCGCDAPQHDRDQVRDLTCGGLAIRAETDPLRNERCERRMVRG